MKADLIKRGAANDAVRWAKKLAYETGSDQGVFFHNDGRVSVHSKHFKADDCDLIVILTPDGEVVDP